MSTISDSRTSDCRVHTDPPARRPGQSALARYRARWGWFFIAPLVVGMTVFVYGAVVVALLLSLTEYNVITPPEWVGFQNFEYLFGWDLFWRALGNTVYYAVGFSLSCFVVALLLALALNQKLPGIVIFRSVYFLPVIISMITAALIWKWLYLPDFGIMNWFLNLVGLPSVRWLLDERWAMPALILMSVWKSAGYYAFIFLAALQNIPQEYYEVATIDGASPWQRFWRITFPLISPTSFFVIVTMIIGSLQIFDQVWLMTRGGPANATYTIVQLIYRNGFELLKFGRASALAVVLLVFIVIATVIQFRLQKRWVTYDL